MRKIINKITASGWFALVLLVCAGAIGTMLHNRFFPTEEPWRQELSVETTQKTDGPSATAHDEICGVKIVWDFLKQEVRLENSNDAVAKVLLAEQGDDHILAPHQKLSLRDNITLGKKAMVEVRVTGTHRIERQYYVLGYKPDQDMVVVQKP